MPINILLRLFIAHICSSYIITQASKLHLNKGNSQHFLFKALFASILAYLFAGSWTSWWIPLSLFIIYYLLNYLYAKLPAKFLYHFLREFLQIIAIVIIWASGLYSWTLIEAKTLNMLNDYKVLLVLCGYLFVSRPLGLFIGKATEKWRLYIKAEETKSQKENQVEGQQLLGLANAGKWIGMCERVLILTFVLTAQYTGIGFLIAAKSIIRFSDKEKATELKTEYILVGTLLSFASCILISTLLVYLLTLN